MFDFKNMQLVSEITLVYTVLLWKMGKLLNSWFSKVLTHALLRDFKPGTVVEQNIAEEAGEIVLWIK